ncbi:DUF4129 domain-containing protein [Tomitella gaofuii]|uniref:DUF4129 domain-containing protein n=1 Tax=Tomitella gaofuii TaxID=2760083 RepID=UPI0015FB6003|nr:DUF4129 domain-containing protein [Tomitella gaofuii]
MGDGDRGVVGFGGVIVTLWQKDRADRRAELWRRLTRAFEQAAYGGGPAAELGVKAVGVISRSRLATREEAALVVAFLRATLPRRADNERGAR